MSIIDLGEGSSLRKVENSTSEEGQTLGNMSLRSLWLVHTKDTPSDQNWVSLVPFGLLHMRFTRAEKRVSRETRKAVARGRAQIRRGGQTNFRVTWLCDPLTTKGACPTY